MRRATLGAWTLCVVHFHSPDGSDFYMEHANIVAARPAAKLREHVAPNTLTLIYGTGGRVYGIRESIEEVAQLMKDCDKK